MKKRSITITTLILGLVPSLVFADGPTLSNYNLMQNIGQMANIVSDISLIMGIGFVLSAIFKFKHYGESRTHAMQQSSVVKPLLMLLVGGLLLSLPLTMETVLTAIWSTSSPLAYHAQTATDELLIPPVLAFIRLVGVGSFIRGLVMLTRVGGEQSQPGTLSKAMLHMLGGVLCLHILGVVQLVQSIFNLS